MLQAGLLFSIWHCYRRTGGINSSVQNWTAQALSHHDKMVSTLEEVDVVAVAQASVNSACRDSWTIRALKSLG